MLAVEDLAVRPDFAVRSVTCDGDCVGWSDLEPLGSHCVVLVRGGRFRRFASGSVADLDRTTAYIGRPGDEERFAHPAGGDVCTSISLPAGSPLVGGGRSGAVHVDARLELAHRRLLLAARGGDVDLAVASELVDLLAAAVPLPSARGAGDAALVAQARSLIVEGHPAGRGLLPLAASLGVSPYRLSRSFTRLAGLSPTRYRNRVRVGRALARLEAGERDLATLAADLGFADQSHLSRTVRAHAGGTPAALRRLLAGPAPPSGAVRSASGPTKETNHG